MVQFRAPVFDIAASALHRLDGGQQIVLPQPVAFYAATFFLVNATYIALIWELIGAARTGRTFKMRAIMHARSLITLCVFGAAALIALRYPIAGLAMCIGCLVLYLRPEPPWAQAADSVDADDS